MSDHNQTRAIRFQSSAVILAALITTGGAVTSAVINVGWVANPVADEPAAFEVAGSSSPKPPAQAFFTGSIEPLVERPSTTLLALPAPPVGNPRPAPSPSWLANTNSAPRERQPAMPKTSAKLFDWEAIPRFFTGRD